MRWLILAVSAALGCVLAWRRWSGADARLASPDSASGSSDEIVGMPTWVGTTWPTQAGQASPDFGEGWVSIDVTDLFKRFGGPIQ